jgi:hypothetical protein
MLRITLVPGTKERLDFVLYSVTVGLKGRGKHLRIKRAEKEKTKTEWGFGSGCA